MPEFRQNGVRADGKTLPAVKPSKREEAPTTRERGLELPNSLPVHAFLSCGADRQIARMPPGGQARQNESMRKFF